MSMLEFQGEGRNLKWGKYSRMDQVKFAEAFKKIEVIGLLQQTISLKFKGCLPQILLGPLLNTLPHTLFLPKFPTFLHN